MQRIVRWSVAALITTLSVVVAPTAAYAAPPVNDEVTSAIVMTDLPFTDSRDVTDATAAPDDPRGCFGVETVWYRFTPDEDVNVAIDTFGSSYDTILSVYTGTPGSLELLDFACADSDQDESGASATTFMATAGTTYFIQAASCCNFPDPLPADGGHLEFHAYVAPPLMDVDVTVDRRATVSRRGVVTLAGTVSCNVPGPAVVAVQSLVQRGGASTSEAGGHPTDEIDSCTSSPTRWSVTVTSATGRQFRPGRTAVATVNASACGLFSCDGEALNQGVRLRRG